jgi:uncharacterized protein (UPF0261 family)
MTLSTKAILVDGTMDSKGPEITYCAKCIRKTECTVLMVDVGYSTDAVVDGIKPDVSRGEVAFFHPNKDTQPNSKKDHSEAIKIYDPGTRLIL